MTKELTTIDFSKKDVIATLKATVAQGLTDPEFVVFAEHCKSTGLNPFKKEVWAIKAGGRLQVMTGINGFMAIANAHPQFDGMEVGLIDENGDYKPISFTGKFVGAWAKVYRKDRKYPAEAAAMLKEYAKNTPIWQQMTRVMIAKCAKSVAIREAFPQELNGLYTQEEMPPEYSESKPDIDLTVADVLQEEQEAEPKVKGKPTDIEIKYRLSFNDPSINFYEWKNRLKKNGFQWDGDRKLWIGKVEYAELASCLVIDRPQEPDYDDIPEAFYEGEGA